MPSNQFNSNDIIVFSLFAAISLHALVILGISFTIPEPSSEPPPDKSLNITIVQNPKTIEKNDNPDFLAQTTQEGSGNSKQKEQPKTVRQDPVAITSKQASQRVENDGIPEPKIAQAPKVLSSKKTEPKKKNNLQDKKAAKPKQLSMSQLLASTQKEIELLSAEIDTQSRLFAEKPRRKQLSASTREYAYANYLDAWRRKVERIGNINYPEEAKRKKLHGSLILTVSIKADGTIDKIRVTRSSGIKILDDAAKRIVRLASPYSAFPAEIRKKYDILDITRTWQFRNTNKLYAQ